MIIQLVHSELEHAVRQYINTQVKVVDGATMVIEFQSGRSNDNFKATIDIRPADYKEKAPQSQSTEPTKPPSFPFGSRPALISSTTRPDPDSIRPEPDPVEPGEEQTSGSTDTTGDLNTAEVAAAATENVEAVSSLTGTDDAGPTVVEEPTKSEPETPAAEAPKAGRRQLFSGLQKPKNN